MQPAGIRQGLAAIIALCAWVGGGSPAHAQPITKEACDTAQAEQQALVRAGIPDQVKKGPAWTEANLGSAKMKDVQRYIALQEQLLFRCGHAKLRNLPGADGDEGDAGSGTTSPGDAAAGPPSASAVLKAKPALAKAAAPKAAAPKPGAKDPGGVAKAADKPKPKAKPKPKVDDAYRPPPAGAPAAKE